MPDECQIIPDKVATANEFITLIDFQSTQRGSERAELLAGKQVAAQRNPDRMLFGSRNRQLSPQPDKSTGHALTIDRSPTNCRTEI